MSRPIHNIIIMDQIILFTGISCFTFIPGKTQKAGRKKRKDRDFSEEHVQLLKKNDNLDIGEVYPASSSGNGDTSEVTKSKELDICVWL